MFESDNESKDQDCLYFKSGSGLGLTTSKQLVERIGG